MGKSFEDIRTLSHRGIPRVGLRQTVSLAAKFAKGLKGTGWRVE